jgi:hypothetical protein
MYRVVSTAQDKKAKLLTSLDDAAYDAAPAPSKQQVREAREKGARDLRVAAQQPKRSRVDPKLRFR